MSSNTLLILLKIVKSALTDPRRIPHLSQVLRSFLKSRQRLLRWRGDNRKTMLISMVEHMGDIVAAEPLARHARAEHPDALIGWVARTPYRELAGSFAALDQVFPVTCLTEWLLIANAKLTDTAWDLHVSGKECPSCGFTLRKSGRPGALTFKTYYNYGNLLAVNCLAADIPVIEGAPKLEPPAPAVAAVDALALPARFVVIHCKSNEDRRDWKAEKWETLVEWISTVADLPIYEIGSRACIAGLNASPAQDLCGRFSILETAEIIRRAALFVGIDSGPAHLANAVGTPGIILLGSYAGFPAYTPYSGGYGDGTLADLIRGEGPASSIPAGLVIEHVGERLGLGNQGIVASPIPTVYPE